MARRHHKPEEIVLILRQVEVLSGQGKSIVDAVRTVGVTEATGNRWRAEYRGLKLDQVKRLKVLEQEDSRLRRAVYDLTLEKLILKEAASGNYGAPLIVVLLWTMGQRRGRFLSVLRAVYWGSTVRRSARRPRGHDKAALTSLIIDLARRYGRYGYRRITALLHEDGWQTSHSGLSGSGGPRGLGCRSGILSVGGSGGMTAPASAFRGLS